MKNITLTFLFIIVFASCRNNGNHFYSIADETAQRLGMTAVEVRNFEGLDGCSWLLLKGDATRFEVVEFPDSLKKTSLKLWVRYTPVKDYMSVCMAGTPVRLTETYYAK